MKSVLITGGCGMIGSNLVKHLASQNWIVYVANNLWRGRLENLNDTHNNPVINVCSNFFRADLTNYDEAQNVIGVADYVIHLADVVAGIDYVFRNQGELFRINNLINSNVFNACRQVGSGKIKGVIYVGTACSFPLTRQNSLNQAPLTEDELFPAMPESAYGWSKLIGQLEIDYLERETGIPCCTLMLHNVYGSPCDFGERSQVIPALIRKAINFPHEKFSVWGSGEQGRAFIHVSDVVNAITLALEKGWSHGYIQIGPDNCTSVKELAAKIIEISGKDIEPFYDLTKPEGDKARCANYQKAHEILGWSPKTSLDDGLREVYSWIEREITR